MSCGCCESMNMQCKPQDNPAHVRENFRRMAALAGVDGAHVSRVIQVHGTAVVRVDASWQDTPEGDAQITDRPGVALMTLHADCPPVYLVDCEHHAVGLVHSGWRGTLANIARQAVQAMEQAFGTRREALLACIGPGIGPCCFEVGMDIAEQFTERGVHRLGPNGRPMLDLWRIIQADLTAMGVCASIAGECTCCQPERYFSHRRQGTERGTMAAFISMIEE